MNEDKRSFYQRRLEEELRSAEAASSSWVRKLHQERARQYQARIAAMGAQAAETSVPQLTTVASEVGHWNTELW